jgi:hypothetical protein
MPRHSSGGQGSSPGLVMWDLWWTKWRWGKFLRILRFPLPIWGWYNRPVSDRSTKWTQSQRPHTLFISILISFSHLSSCLPSLLFQKHFNFKRVFFISDMLAVRPTHLIFLAIVAIFDKSLIYDAPRTDINWHILK